MGCRSKSLRVLHNVTEYALYWASLVAQMVKNLLAMFLTQGLNPSLLASPALQVDSLPLSHLWYCYLLLSITSTARYKNQWKADGAVNSLKTF